jgi:hypothetical protein
MAKVSSATHSTRWSLIVRAQAQGSGTRVALGELIGHYENFVVWLIRHHGHPPDTNPEELKQEFLEGVLRRNDIAKLDRARGSFRGWLGLAVRRFLMNEWDKWKAASAGRRGTSPVGLQAVDVEAPPDDASEREFVRHVVLRALSLHRAEERDKARFDALARFLPGPQMDLVELAPLAGSLGMTSNALAKAICLLRGRFRELLRAAVRDSLDLEPPPEAIADEALLEAARREEARLIDDELRELRRHFWS